MISCKIDSKKKCLLWLISFSWTNILLLLLYFFFNFNCAKIYYICVHVMCWLIACIKLHGGGGGVVGGKVVKEKLLVEVMAVYVCMHVQCMKKRMRAAKDSLSQACVKAQWFECSHEIFNFHFAKAIFLFLRTSFIKVK